jgi:hypothetical protein
VNVAKVPHMGVGEIVGAVGAVVAVGAFGVALLARRDSKASARAAVTSAESSERSAVAAEQSFELSRLDARRRVERTDVEWERDKRKGHRGVVVYRNVGATTAYAVTAVLTINDQRFDLAFGDVEPNGLTEHDASELYNHAAQRHAAAVRNADSAGVFFVGSPHFDVTARISWESELGTPSIRTL